MCVQLQSSVTEFEFSQEDYRMLQVEFWSKFYACCLQYQEALSTPLALHVDQATAMVCLLKKVPNTTPNGVMRVTLNVCKAVNVYCGPLI